MDWPGLAAIVALLKLDRMLPVGGAAWHEAYSRLHSCLSIIFRCSEKNLNGESFFGTLNAAQVCVCVLINKCLSVCVCVFKYVRVCVCVLTNKCSSVMCGYGYVCV